MYKSFYFFNDQVLVKLRERVLFKIGLLAFLINFIMILHTRAYVIFLCNTSIIDSSSIVSMFVSFQIYELGTTEIWIPALYHESS